MRLTTTQPTSPYIRRQHTTNPDSAAGHSCIHLARRDTFQPGAQHTTKQAGNLPDSEVFSRSKFEDGLSFQGIHGYGAGSAYPQGRQHNLFCVLKPSSTICPQQADGGLSVRQGTKTMTTATHTATFQGNTPIQSTTVISRHQAIENALSMALFHIRKGDTQQDIHSAMAKANRATSLLKQSCSDLFSGSV